MATDGGLERIEEIRVEAAAAIEAAAGTAELEELRVRYLGRKAELTTILRGIAELPAEERGKVGGGANKARKELEAQLESRAETLDAGELESRLAEDRVDVTLPGAPARSVGHTHLITRTTRQIEDVMVGLGYRVMEGPEVEHDYYNFTALNHPPGHPARMLQDTFYVQSDPEVLLRTHTSPVQIRTMLAKKPPIRVIIPGRTYRSDSDQTHTPMFHQVEGLVIDKSAHLGHLKWILQEFCKAFFEVDQVKMRFRPSFFPFTEPSLEVDIQCRRDKGEIRFGEGDDWLEILGCGMVHPNVLRNCGLDPDEYQGFAWGMGIDRIAMLKYGMPDLRAFFEADMRWLAHYGFRPLDFPTLAGGLSA
jgi:phenylalanyl-tRNA synthetase alpha chain